MSVKPRSAPGSRQQEVLSAAAALEGPNEVRGYVYAPDTPETRFVVELLADGAPVGLARADVYRHDLGTAGVGDGCYGFLFVVEPAVLANAAVLDVQLANTGEVVGGPMRLDGILPARPRDLHASVTWMGGLRLVGALPKGHTDPATTARALIDGQVVAEALPDGWTHVAQGGAWHIARSFDLHLPERFADGRARRVEVALSDGSPVTGSPCMIVAFPDGLERFIRGYAEIESETIRARFFDALIPQSLPFSNWEAWAERFPRQAATTGRAFGVVLVGEGDIGASLDSLEGQTEQGWVAASLPNVAGQGTFATNDLETLLAGEAKHCPTVVFALSGTRLAPDALAALEHGLSRFPAASAVYGDLISTAGGQAWPLFLTAFDYERCLEQGYCALFFALRRPAVLAAVAAGATDMFRTFNAHLDGWPCEAELPVHVPGALAQLPQLAPGDLTGILLQASDRHLRARATAARLAAHPGTILPGVRIGRVPARARVSILIPTRNRLDLLQTCLASLRATAADVDHEIIVIDNDSSDPDLLAFYDRESGPRVRITKRPGHFNFASLINAGASLATGDALLLLNNDVEATEAGWLGEMLGRMSEPDVGAVGALLVWPSGIVQHGGVVLGPNFTPTEAFKDRLNGDPGYGELLSVAHECSAVTGACLLTRRDLFRARGGLDAVRFPVNFNDVDYCLRLRSDGYRIVFTPYARLSHRESASRGTDQPPDRKARAARDLTNLRNRWGEVLMADPFYSPLLSLDMIPYSALAWPPRSMEPRQRERPVGRNVPPGA